VILSDREILQRLATGDIIIDPEPDRDIQVGPSSVDLRLGNEFIVFRREKKPFIDPFADDPTLFTEKVVLSEDEPFIIHPGEFVLASTEEYVRVPSDLVARVDGRSSLGRLGIIIHATAGFIDPGFEGTITLEITNINVMPVALYPGMRICQISFETMNRPAERPYGVKTGSKYQGQRGPTVSRLKWDRR